MIIASALYFCVHILLPFIFYILKYISADTSTMGRMAYACVGYALDQIHLLLLVNDPGHAELTTASHGNTHKVERQTAY